MAGYERSGYGYHDYGEGQKHEYILGSYGLSVARPSAIMRLLEDVPGIRILCYQEKGWGNNHDVVTIGRPDWDESWWPTS